MINTDTHHTNPGFDYAEYQVDGLTVKTWTYHHMWEMDIEIWQDGQYTETMTILL